MQSIRDLLLWGSCEWNYSKQLSVTQVANTGIQQKNKWIPASCAGARMTFQSAIQSIEFPLPSSKSDHQIINAGNAIAACSILSGKYGFDIGERILLEVYDIPTGLHD